MAELEDNKPKPAAGVPAVIPKGNTPAPRKAPVAKKAPTELKNADGTEAEAQNPDSPENEGEETEIDYMGFKFEQGKFSGDWKELGAKLERLTFEKFQKLGGALSKYNKANGNNGKAEKIDEKGEPSPLVKELMEKRGLSREKAEIFATDFQTAGKNSPNGQLNIRIAGNNINISGSNFRITIITPGSAMMGASQRQGASGLQASAPAAPKPKTHAEIIDADFKEVKDDKNSPDAGNKFTQLAAESDGQQEAMSTEAQKRKPVLALAAPVGPKQGPQQKPTGMG
ncbi:MAG: hypothetical protein KGQ41_01845 [Alphaproteobacteria bacterium]|nr:hypothetical protein [Alphaproteobacteria bacterium]